MVWCGVVRYGVVRCGVVLHASSHASTCKCITPHPTTPHHTTPHLTIPHHTTPHNTTPHLTTPYLTTPHHTTEVCLVQWLKICSYMHTYVDIHTCTLRTCVHVVYHMVFVFWGTRSTLCSISHTHTLSLLFLDTAPSWRQVSC